MWEKVDLFGHEHPLLSTIIAKALTAAVAALYVDIGDAGLIRRRTLGALIWILDIDIGVFRSVEVEILASLVYASPILVSSICCGIVAAYLSEGRQRQAYRNGVLAEVIVTSVLSIGFLVLSWVHYQQYINHPSLFLTSSQPTLGAFSEGTAILFVVISTFTVLWTLSLALFWHDRFNHNPRRAVREATVVVVILVAVGGTLGFSILYPFAFSETGDGFAPPHTAGEDEYSFTASTEIEYRGVYYDGTFEGSVSTSGELFSRMVYYDRSGFKLEMMERYRPRDQSGEYQRRLMGIPIESYLEFVEDDPDRELLYEGRDEGLTEVITYTTEPNAGLNESLNQAFSWTSRIPEPAYKELTDPSGENVTVLKPQSGWFQNSRGGTYRVTSASGNVHVNRETRTVVAADTRWKSTPVLNYLSYWVNRDETRAVHFEFEKRSNNVTVNPPDWVGDVQVDSDQ